jgi:hypothetical protein
VNTIVFFISFVSVFAIGIFVGKNIETKKNNLTHDTIRVFGEARIETVSIVKYFPKEERKEKKRKEKTIAYVLDTVVSAPIVISGDTVKGDVEIKTKFFPDYNKFYLSSNFSPIEIQELKQEKNFWVNYFIGNGAGIGVGWKSIGIGTIVTGREQFYYVQYMHWF